MFSVVKWIDLSTFLLLCHEAGVEMKLVYTRGMDKHSVVTDHTMVYRLGDVECPFYRQQNGNFAASDQHPQTILMLREINKEVAKIA